VLKPVKGLVELLKKPLKSTENTEKEMAKLRRALDEWRFT